MFIFTNGDLGGDQHEVEFEPIRLPAEEPIQVPVPEEAPVEPELVPA